MRRRQKGQLANTGQRALGFPDESDGLPERAAQPADDWFQDDDPRGLFVGDERLEKYLRCNAMGWVVRLRTLLEGLDYSLLTQRYDILGRKALHPRTLLGLIVYGIVLKQSSLRELQTLAVRDVGAWWMCGGKQPDHSTIGKFIQLHAQALSVDFFTALMRQVVKCLHLQPGTAAGDGTVIEAAASRYGLLKTEVAERWATQAAEQAARHPEDAQCHAHAVRCAEVARVAGERSASRERQGKAPEGIRVAYTEPSAVVQPTKDGRYCASYKPSLLVHQSGLIVGQGVHASSERAVLGPMLRQHEAIFGCDPPRVLLDAGYFATETLAGLAARGIDVLCPPGTARTDEEWEKRPGVRRTLDKSHFVYDPERDQYRCPQGQWMSRWSRGRDHHGHRFVQYGTRACAHCALRAQCTTSRKGRTIKRYEGDEYKDAMRAVLGQARARQAYRQRGALAEPRFAEIRERQGLRRFHRRGPSGVQVEWALHCIALNLKRALGRSSLSILLITVYRAGWSAPAHVLVVFRT